MFVPHFTSEVFGGAGVAAQRLHESLRREGVESRLYYRSGTPFATDCEPMFQNRSFFGRNASALAQSWRNRRNADGCFFTSPTWIRKTPLTTLVKRPDVVNLHWISRWIDQTSFFASLPLRLPVVWSLHDMNPLTGGCHHAGECVRFASHCGNCPQLKDPAPRDDASRFFDVKKRCYAGINLHIVGNSEWTTTQARRSALMRHTKSIQTIPLGLDTEAFKPVDKLCARQALKIGVHRFVVGFACTDFSDRNKGGALLVEALNALAGEAADHLASFWRWLAAGGRRPISNCETRRLAFCAFAVAVLFSL